MSFRFMRVLCFFDLPVETDNDRRSYRIFRKWLIRSGFVMMQESVYSKLCLNMQSASIVIDNVMKNRPPKGLCQLIVITERQFEKMVFVVGEAQSEYVTSTDRLVVL